MSIINSSLSMVIKSDSTLTEKNIGVNGEYDANQEGYDGYSKVNVNVTATPTHDRITGRVLPENYDGFYILLRNVSNQEQVINIYRNDILYKAVTIPYNGQATTYEYYWYEDNFTTPRRQTCYSWGFTPIFVKASAGDFVSISPFDTYEWGKNAQSDGRKIKIEQFEPIVLSDIIYTAGDNIYTYQGSTVQEEFVNTYDKSLIGFYTCCSITTLNNAWGDYWCYFKEKEEGESTDNWSVIYPYDGKEYFFILKMWRSYSTSNLALSQYDDLFGHKCLGVYVDRNTDWTLISTSPPLFPILIEMWKDVHREI